MADRKTRLAAVLVAVAVVLAVLVTWTVAGAQEVPENPENDETGDNSAAPSDSLRFGADLRAAEKPVEVVGQYAYTSVNGNVLESSYSSERQPRETRTWTKVDDDWDDEDETVSYGEACVYGGGEGGRPARSPPMSRVRRPWTATWTRCESSPRC